MSLVLTPGKAGMGGALRAPRLVGSAIDYRASAASATPLPMPAGVQVGDHTLVMVVSTWFTTPSVKMTGGNVYNTRLSRTQHENGTTLHVSAFTLTFESTSQINTPPTVQHGDNSIIFHLVTRDTFPGGGANGTAIGLNRTEARFQAGSYAFPARGTTSIATAPGTFDVYALAQFDPSSTLTPSLNAVGESTDGPPILPLQSTAIGQLQALFGYERRPSGAPLTRYWRLHWDGANSTNLGQISVVIPIEGP